MKRFLQSLLLAFFLWLPLVSVATVQTTSAIAIFGGCTSVSGASATDVCKETTKTGNPVTTAIGVVIDILSVVIGVSAVVVIILSGFKMIRSNGNPQEVSTARGGIIYAAIGLVIAVLAPLFVGFVLSKL